jgi:hypothetical protein
MHTTVVISAGDAPEWISVLHADGSLSEVRVAVENDNMHIFIEPADGKAYTVNGPGQWIPSYGDG